MADPVVDYSVVPVEGNAPLTVSITLNSVEICNTELDPFAMAHEGFLNSDDYLFNGFQMSHFGYFVTVPQVVYLWKFGDGTTSSSTHPGIHTYQSPGNYTLTLCLFVDGFLYEFPTDIVVYTNPRGGDYGVPGIGQNKLQRDSLTYGNDETQGIGWSKNSGDGFLWPDSPGSIIAIFNEENDHEQLIIDSLTGLPYIFDSRKLGSSSLIDEVWKDKVNPLVEGSGTEITSRVRMAEYIGSHESYFQQMSDINLFFEPMYQANQGADGYSEKGLRDAFEVDLELYADEKLSKSAHADNVPLDRELFFDRKVKGHILQIAFEMATSEYRFTRSEVYLTNYDHAVWPSANQPMTERPKQDLIGDLIGWYSRSETPLVDLVTCNDAGYTGEFFRAPNTPDNYKYSGFILYTDNLKLDYDYSKYMVLWTTNENAVSTNNTSTITTIGQTQVSINTWYLLLVEVSTVVDVQYTLLGGGTRYFDVRVYDLQTRDGDNLILTTEDLQYIYDDTVENNANAICPSWF